MRLLDFHCTGGGLFLCSPYGAVCVFMLVDGNCSIGCLCYLTVNVTDDYDDVCLLLLCGQISLGTVTNVAEAVGWLRYTYLFVRMLANPLAYGVRPGSLQVSASPVVYFISFS